MDVGDVGETVVFFCMAESAVELVGDLGEVGIPLLLGEAYQVAVGIASELTPAECVLQGHGFFVSFFCSVEDYMLIVAGVYYGETSCIWTVIGLKWLNVGLKGNSLFEGRTTGCSPSIRCH